MLPPLANLVAIYEPDPGARARLAITLREHSGATDVSEPSSGWLAATFPLPHGEPDGPEVRAAGLLFAEGRDVVAQQGPASSPFAHVAQLAAGAPHSLARLNGDFGFLQFQPDGSLVVVRSCGGLVPFYFWTAGDRVAVTTRLGDLVRYVEHDFQLDPLVNAVWTTGHGFFPDDRTFVSDVRILGRGHFARLRPGRSPEAACYWDPRPQRLARVTPEREREHAERLRAILLRRLEEDLDPSGENLLTLSGGVDSSSLAALAIRRAGRRLSTLSFLPEPEEFRQRDLSYIEPLARTLGFGRQWHVVLTAERFLGLLRGAPLNVFHILHPALNALPGILRETPIRVLVGGEFADEVCGSRFTFPDWVQHTSPLGLLRSMRRLPSGPRDVLRWGKHRALGVVRPPALPFPDGLPELIRDEVHEEYLEWLDRRRRAVSVDSRPWRHLSLRAELDGFVAMNWEATSALGIRRSLPFFNREALELAYECSPAELVGPGTKRLLRNALRSDVPERNLNRADKGQSGRYLESSEVEWQGAVPSELNRVVRDDWLFDRARTIGFWSALPLQQLTNCAEAMNSGGASTNHRVLPVPLAGEFATEVTVNQHT